MRSILVPVTVLVALLAPALAAAQVCVELDEAADNLSEADRSAALILLGQTFEDEGVEVAADGCTTTYRVSHVQLGQAITVTLSGPEGQRRATAAGLEELPPVYAQLLYALRNGEEVGTGSANRTNVTQAQDAPRRVQTDNMFYIRLGGGAIFGAGVGGGPSFGIGYRFELDHIGIDASFANILVDQGNDAEAGDGGVNGSWVRIAALYFFNGINQNTGYIGGGLSWGGSYVCGDRRTVDGVSEWDCYSDSGLQGELTGGYELLRASTIRLFFEGNVVLPFYNADSDFAWIDDRPERSVYTPTITGSIGLGFGRRNRGYR